LDPLHVSSHLAADRHRLGDEVGRDVGVAADGQTVPAELDRALDNAVNREVFGADHLAFDLDRLSDPRHLTPFRSIRHIGSRECAILQSRSLYIGSSAHSLCPPCTGLCARAVCRFGATLSESMRGALSVALACCLLVPGPEASAQPNCGNADPEI